MVAGVAAAAAVAGAGAGASSPGNSAALASSAASARAVPGQLIASPSLAVPGGGSIHRFRQRIGGRPVLGGELVVAVTPEREPIVVVDRTGSGLVAAGAPATGRRAAIRRARRAADASRLRGAPRARLGVDPASGKLAWRVLLPAARPRADFAVTVDATSGRPLAVRDLLRRAGPGLTGAAFLFHPNPVVTQGSAAGLRDDKDRKSPLLAGLRRSVELPRLESGRGCLRGAYVDARLGREARPVCKRSRSWVGAQRSTNSFEALMAYFHIDRTRAYIDSLGLTRGLSRKPQRVRANGITADNSFYSPISRGLTLGTGGVDDGEDADVIIHEYGHAVQDQQVRFFGEHPEGAALGEGFGDYLAAVMSSQATGGSPRFDPCMFEWDAVSYTRKRCARRTDTALTVPRAKAICFDDPHCLGAAWSGALWELRGRLAVDPEGRWVIDRVLLQSHFMLARRSDARDGARALLAADDLLYAGAHRDAIAAELIERGFCPRRGC